jgi:hypothetical protein
MTSQRKCAIHFSTGSGTEPGDKELITTVTTTTATFSADEKNAGQFLGATTQTTTSTTYLATLGGRAGHNTYEKGPAESISYGEAAEVLGGTMLNEGVDLATESASSTAFFEHAASLETAGRVGGIALLLANPPTTLGVAIRTVAVAAIDLINQWRQAP